MVNIPEGCRVGLRHYVMRTHFVKLKVTLTVPPLYDTFIVFFSIVY